MLVDLRRTHRLAVQKLAQEDLGLRAGHLVDLGSAALVHVCVLWQRCPSDNSKVDNDKSIRLSGHDSLAPKKRELFCFVGTGCFTGAQKTSLSLVVPGDIIKKIKELRITEW